MTKKINVVASHRFSMALLPAIKPLSQMWKIHLFGILNLDHWYLFEIWFLVLGIFMIFIKQAFSVISAN